VSDPYTYRPPRARVNIYDDRSGAVVGQMTEAEANDLRAALTHQPDQPTEPDPLRDILATYQLNGPEAEELAISLRVDRRSPSDDEWSPNQARLRRDIEHALDTLAERAYGRAPILR